PGPTAGPHRHDARGQHRSGGRYRNPIRIRRARRTFRMTDFLSTGTLPEEYRDLALTVRDFAQSVVAPVAAEHDAAHTFPYEVVAGMAEMGLFGLPFPE